MPKTFAMEIIIKILLGHQSSQIILISQAFKVYLSILHQGINNIKSEGKLIQILFGLLRRTAIRARRKESSRNVWSHLQFQWTDSDNLKLYTVADLFWRPKVPPLSWWMTTKSKCVLADFPNLSVVLNFIEPDVLLGCLSRMGIGNSVLHSWCFFLGGRFQKVLLLIGIQRTSCSFTNPAGLWDLQMGAFSGWQGRWGRLPGGGGVQKGTFASCFLAKAPSTLLV